MNQEDAVQGQLLSDLTDIFNKNNRLRKPLMEASFPELSLSEIESLEVIGKMENPNVTKLADALYITRGAASKITRKLIAKKLITSYSKSENKKEIYFSLTSSGHKINSKHSQLHRDFLAQDKAVFVKFDERDLTIISNFIKAYNEHLDGLLKKSSK